MFERGKFTDAQRQDYTAAVIALRVVGEPHAKPIKGDGPVVLGGEVGKRPRDSVWWRDGSQLHKLSEDRSKWCKLVVKRLSQYGLINPRDDDKRKILGSSIAVASVVVGAAVSIATYGTGTAGGVAIASAGIAAGAKYASGGSGADALLASVDGLEDAGAISADQAAMFTSGVQAGQMVSENLTEDVPTGLEAIAADVEAMGWDVVGPQIVAYMKLKGVPLNTARSILTALEDWLEGQGLIGGE